MSPILTLTRVHLGDLGGHELKSADASGLIVTQGIYYCSAGSEVSFPR